MGTLWRSGSSMEGRSTVLIWLLPLIQFKTTRRRWIALVKTQCSCHVNCRMKRKDWSCEWEYSWVLTLFPPFVWPSGLSCSVDGRYWHRLSHLQHQLVSKCTNFRALLHGKTYILLQCASPRMISCIITKLRFSFRCSFDCCGMTDGTDSWINSYSSLEVPCGLLLVTGFFWGCHNKLSMGSGTESMLWISAAKEWSRKATSEWSDTSGCGKVTLSFISVSVQRWWKFKCSRCDEASNN